MTSGLPERTSMTQVDRRQMLAASAALGVAAAARTDPGQALPAAEEGRLRFRELPRHVRRSMAHHWVQWPIYRDGWQFFPHPIRKATLDAVAGALDPAFEAGARHGYFFYRQAQGRLPVVSSDAVAEGRVAAALSEAPLAAYPHFLSERDLLDKRLRAVVAWAEWDGYFYRGPRATLVYRRPPVAPAVAAQSGPNTEATASSHAAVRKTYRLGNQCALFGSLGLAADE